MSEKPLGLLSKCPNSKFQMTEWSRKSLATLVVNALARRRSSFLFFSRRSHPIPNSCLAASQNYFFLLFLFLFSSVDLVPDIIGTLMDLEKGNQFLCSLLFFSSSLRSFSTRSQLFFSLSIIILGKKNSRQVP